MQARQAEDKKIFDGLRRRYRRQAAENEADLMARIWETERAQVVKLRIVYSELVGYQTSGIRLLWTIITKP